MTGEPVRVSVCHCLNCKKRSGSAFAVQARWPKEQARIEGTSKSFVKVADSGNRATFHFCPDCGSDVYYEIDSKFDDRFNHLVAIPLGAFDDPYFAAPSFSVWEERKHDWVEISGPVERPH
ncbi:MAG TPA: GFA family protein [Sphingomicrobium sp.]